MTEELISYTDLQDYESGKYRVRFENRTQWNCELIVDTDEESHHVDSAVLYWFDPEGIEDKHRTFHLESDDEGNVITDDKPEWGRMTRLAPR